MVLFDQFLDLEGFDHVLVCLFLCTCCSVCCAKKGFLCCCVVFSAGGASALLFLLAHVVAFICFLGGAGPFQ